MSHDARTFTSDGVELAYRAFGRPGAMPIVIVHGLSFFSYDWIGPASALASDREVVAMDMRGFGDSGWSSDYSVPAFARDIIALLDHRGWRQAILIGHSMGGRNCTYCAAKNPDRIAALILVDWSPDLAPAGGKRVTETVAATPDSFPTIEDAMRYFHVDPDSPDGARKRARFEAYLRPQANGLAVKRDPHFRNQFRRLRETGERPKLGVDMWAALGEVKCPVSVIRGSRSDMFASETIPKVIAANPHLSLVEVDAGHDVAGDNATGFLREVRSFLATQDIGGGVRGDETVRQGVSPAGD